MRTLRGTMLGLAIATGCAPLAGACQWTSATLLGSLPEKALDREFVAEVVYIGKDRDSRLRLRVMKTIKGAGAAMGEELAFNAGICASEFRFEDANIGRTFFIAGATRPNPAGLKTFQGVWRIGAYGKLEPT